MSQHTAPVTIGQVAPVSLDGLRAGYVSSSKLYVSNKGKRAIIAGTDIYVLNLSACRITDLEREGEDLNDFITNDAYALGIRI